MADARSNVVNRLFGKRNRHQVVELAAVAAIRQVFGVDARLVHVEKMLEVVQKAVIKRRRTSYR